MDFIQGVGGELVPHRRPYGRRALLPYELDLCNELGITPDEYWQFIFDAQEYLADRPKEYANIPDIRNEPISTATWIYLAVGVALTVAGALLAPKPKAPKSRGREPLEIAGRDGKSRFSRSNEFDSVQQLAKLGQTIPLVFANQVQVGEYVYGGIRMETDLLWSQMVSNGNGQLLYALLTLGMTTLGEKPDYDGIAIGDLLLRDFSGYKNRVFFNEEADTRTTNRLNQDDVYLRSKLWESDTNDTDVLKRYELADDVFQLRDARDKRWRPWFSGARTPSTATEFGAYSPLPNGHRFYVPFELVMILQGAGSDVRRMTKMKQRKMVTPFPRMAGITNIRPNPKDEQSHSGKIVTYTVYNDDRDVAWFTDDFIDSIKIDTPPKMG